MLYITYYISWTLLYNPPIIYTTVLYFLGTHHDDAQLHSWYCGAAGMYVLCLSLSFSNFITKCQ